MLKNYFPIAVALLLLGAAVLAAPLSPEQSEAVVADPAGYELLQVDAEAGSASDDGLEIEADNESDDETESDDDEDGNLDSDGGAFIENRSPFCNIFICGNRLCRS